MSDPISKGGSKPPSQINQSEISSTPESTAKDSAQIQKGSTPEETQDPKKLAKAEKELASTQKFDMQLQSMSQKLAAELPKKEAPAGAAKGTACRNPWIHHQFWPSSGWDDRDGLQ